MPTMAVIDDRADSRIPVVEALELALPEWNIIGIAPLPTLDHYPSWISEYEISVLIVDERLHQAAPLGGKAVGYRGNELLTYLRKKIDRLPMFVITTWPKDDPLQKKFSEADDIIDRTIFASAPRSYVPRFVRASQRYLEVFERELAELSQIAQKAASGENVSVEEQTRARAIQQQINTSFSLDDIQTRQQWIGKMEDAIHELEVLKEEVESHLGGDKNHEVDEDS